MIKKIFIAILFIIICLIVSLYYMYNNYIYNEHAIPINNNVIIFSEHYKPDWEKSYLNQVRRWTPTKDEVLQAEKFFHQYLLSEKEKTFPTSWSDSKKGKKKNMLFNLIARFNKDKRQYFGIVENNRKILWIHGFCDDYFGLSWKMDEAIIFEGGDCNYYIRIDLEINEISLSVSQGY